jgi:hypothetical protein
MPPMLDLREADTKTMVPRDWLNEADIEATRLAWLPVIKPYLNETKIRIALPNGGDRITLALSANQVLKAHNPLIKIFLAYDENAPSCWDESFWSALDGGIIAPENLPAQPGRWRFILAKAQEQLPARTWTMYCPLDPGPEAARLLGAGAWLVVPPDSPTALLANMIPHGLDKVEGAYGTLTLREESSQRAMHWRFKDSEWQAFTPENEHETVVIQGSTPDYDIHALLSKVRATQLRDQSALHTQESSLSINIHAQSSGGMGAELGYVFCAFEKTGEPEEFTQEQVMFNGVKANIQGGLQLPFIESKRSISPPVALNLTERYNYSDGGPEGGGKRWIRFSPTSDDPTLFSGQILVSEASGRILEERSERSNLPGVVKSEKRKLVYGAPAPSYWRVMSIQTFERWVLSGGVTQVQRDLTYQNFRINEGDFLERREQARASKITMLRQTEEGMRYLVKDKDGKRHVEHKQRTFGRAIGGAILVDPTLQYPVIPGAALAVFDYDAFGKGIQYYALVAGIFNMANITIPHLPGGFDVGLQASGGILAFTERPVKDGKLQDSDGVSRQSGQMRVSVGRDIGAGFRMRLQGIGIYNRYSEAKESEYRTPGYIIPPSGFTLGFTSELSWLHRGFQLRGNYGAGSRPSGTFGSPEEQQSIADGGKYERWGASVGYDLRFKNRAWIHGELGMDGGSGFDRFMSLDLGGRVSGIRNNAVVSDSVTFASLGYVLPASKLFRITFKVDHAQARSLDDQKTYGFTGMSIAGDIPGFWWFTTVRADIGIGLLSDIPGVRGVNGYIALLRVF